MQKRILIVDDNKDCVDSLAMLLEMNGYEALASLDSADALVIAASERPDVILLDIGMPGIDGFELCRRLRREPWGKDALIVAITGWGREADQDEAFAAGCDHHFLKPVQFDALRGLLSSRLAA